MCSDFFASLMSSPSLYFCLYCLFFFNKREQCTYESLRSLWRLHVQCKKQIVTIAAGFIIVIRYLKCCKVPRHFKQTTSLLQNTMYRLNSVGFTKNKPSRATQSQPVTKKFPIGNAMARFDYASHVIHICIFYLPIKHTEVFNLNMWLRKML